MIDYDWIDQILIDQINGIFIFIHLKKVLIQPNENIRFHSRKHSMRLHSMKKTKLLLRFLVFIVKQRNQ